MKQNIIQMPKTKTVYSKYKAVRLSDKGNQMLSNLCRLSESDSEASFIRNAIVFYMNNAMNPKIAEFWDKQDVPEINDYYVEELNRITKQFDLTKLND